MFVKRNIGNALLAGSIAALASCVSPGPTAGGPFSLTSFAFKDGTMLETKNAGNNKANPNCIGDNVSPPLSWSNVPAGTRSFALLMVDPEGRLGLGVNHWIAYGIPSTVSGFAEGETSQLTDKYVGGKGTQGLGYYLGPCTPPNTGLHHYTFTLIATDLEPDALPPGLTRDEVVAKLAGHSKGAAGLVGLFGRP
jgi:Raf kinase inhibitor-like YbhB/YbcL family protein